jgi:hypothetical protein
MRAIVVAGTVLALAGAAHPYPFPKFGAGCTRADFRSGGTTIRAER